MIIQDNPQLTVVSNDMRPTLVKDVTFGSLIALLLVIENDHPGTLAWVVREAALIADNWNLKSRSSKPDHSLTAQAIAEQWLRDRDDAYINAVNQLKGE